MKTNEDRFPLGTKVKPQAPSLHSWNEGEIIGYNNEAWPMKELHIKITKGSNKFEAVALCIANEIEKI